MNIKEMDKTRLRNDEHFMFHTEFKNLLTTAGAQNLRVAAQFAEYGVLFAKEDEGLKKIVKSAITAQIQDEDKIRDELYNGMVELSNAMLKSPFANKREAAKRLKIVFDTYGNISKKPINEQTSAVINILQELNGAYAQDAQTVGIGDYVSLIETHNNALAQLVRERYGESAGKTDVVMAQARQNLDAVYDVIVARINALALLEGGEVCENFIRTFNTIIAKYSAILNARLGKKHSGGGNKPDYPSGGGSGSGGGSNGGGSGQQEEEGDPEPSGEGTDGQG